MPARLLTGREPADAILAALRPRVAALNPKLVILQAGDDPASAAYIGRKLAAAASIELRAEHVHLAADVTFEALLERIQALNADPDVTGFLVQSPLPPALQPRFPEAMRAMDPHKDIDGLTAYNLGKTLLAREYEHLPAATAAGVIALLEHYGIPVEGKDAVVIGRSHIVGKPLAAMLLNRSATVTVCHSRTPDLAAHARRADLLIAAAGSPGLVTADMVKPGAVVVDVGLSRTEDGLRGDCAEEVREVASAITPVPGGVGPMTVACLLRNCVRAAERQMGA